MKKLLGILTICFMIACTTIEQNEEGVAIHRTETDSSKVYSSVKGRIFTFFDWNTDYIHIPMYQQKGSIASQEVKTSDRTTFTLDSIIYTYQPQRGHGQQITKQFRQFATNDEFLDMVEDQVFEITLRALMRDVTLKFTSDSLLSHTNNYVAALREGLNKEFNSKGFDFQTITMNIHEPEAIKKIMEAKSNSIQQAEAAKAKATEAQSRQLIIEAEQKSRVAEAKADLEVATLEAESRKITVNSYSPAYLEYLKIYYWGEAKCPPQTIFYNGNQRVELNK